MTDLNRLNIDFGIADQLHFIKGGSGFGFIEVSNDHASAKISLYAAQILAFQPKEQAEPVLFLSEQAEYQQDKVIRGGSPVCWPWFSDERKDQGLPSHGLVRKHVWDVISTQAETDGSTTIVLEIKDDEESRKLWPHPFKLQLEVHIAASLSLTLTTYNIGKQAFAMSEALHTYFAVSDVNNIEITGLDGLIYLDKCLDFVPQTQYGNVRFDGEVDRIYQAVKQDVVLCDIKFNRQIRIASHNSNSCVIWNPATSLDDVVGDGYKGFVCIESANVVTDNITVPAGEQHRIKTVYSVESI